MSKRSICLIGNGVTAHYFLFLLSSVKLSFDIHIKWIYSEKLFPRVNDQIWPIVTLNGIQKGINVLGDSLHESFFHFLRVNNTYQFANKIEQFLICNNKDPLDRDNFKRRHGRVDKINFCGEVVDGVCLESFFVVPSEFFGEIETKVQNNNFLFLEKIEGLVTEVKPIKNDFLISLLDGTEISTNNCFVFAGVGSKFLPVDFFEGSKVQRNQISKGGIFCSACNIENHQKFILTQGKDNIIFDGNGYIQTNIAPCVKESFLKDFYEDRFGPLFNKDNVSEFIGLRDKGHKRRPNKYLINDPQRFLFKLNGLYKNAWTIGLKEVDEVLKIWLERTD